MNPGMALMPFASITRSPCVPAAPADTDTIRPPRTMIVAGVYHLAVADDDPRVGNCEILGRCWPAQNATIPSAAIATRDTRTAVI